MKFTNFWLPNMDHTISAAEANRSFSRVLREVGEGRSYIVTSHGRPVARITPAADEAAKRTRTLAKRALLDRLRRLSVQNLGKWSRDELYDE